MQGKGAKVGKACDGGVKSDASGAVTDRQTTDRKGKKEEINMKAVNDSGCNKNVKCEVGRVSFFDFFFQMMTLSPKANQLIY